MFTRRRGLSRYEGTIKTISRHTPDINAICPNREHLEKGSCLHLFQKGTYLCAAFPIQRYNLIFFVFAQVAYEVGAFSSEIKPPLQLISFHSTSKVNID